MRTDDPIDVEMNKRLRSGGPMRDALQWAEEAWDTELNRAYKAALASLSTPQRLLLQDSQRMWQQFRDREFSLLVRLYNDGEKPHGLDSPAQLALYEDRVNLVKARAVALRRYKDNPYRTVL